MSVEHPPSCGFALVIWDLGLNWHFWTVWCQHSKIDRIVVFDNRSDARAALDGLLKRNSGGFIVALYDYVGHGHPNRYTVDAVMLEEAPA